MKKLTDVILEKTAQIEQAEEQEKHYKEAAATQLRIAANLIYGLLGNLMHGKRLSDDDVAALRQTIIDAELRYKDAVKGQVR